jgi:hypothetical protein
MAKITTPHDSRPGALCRVKERRRLSLVYDTRCVVGRFVESTGIASLSAIVAAVAIGVTVVGHGPLFRRTNTTMAVAAPRQARPRLISVSPCGIKPSLVYIGNFVVRHRASPFSQMSEPRRLFVGPALAVVVIPL